MASELAQDREAEPLPLPTELKLELELELNLTDDARALLLGPPLTHSRGVPGVCNVITLHISSGTALCRAASLPLLRLSD
jgi:hypothetical protein